MSFIISRTSELLAGLASTDTLPAASYIATPKLTASGNVSGLTNKTSEIISGTVSDLNGVARVEVYDTVAGFTTYLGDATLRGTSWSLTKTGLTNGTHNFTAVATDMAGNRISPQPAGAAVVVDTTAPKLTACENVSGLTNKTSEIISGTVSDLNGVASVEVYDTVAGVTTYLGVATLRGTSWSLTKTGLTNGTHNFTAVATDMAGNRTSPLPAGAVVVVDTTAPKLTASENVSGLTNKTSEIISGTVSDLNGVASVEVYDTVAGVTTYLGVATLRGTSWSLTKTGLTNGTHNFSAVATDMAGNRTGSLSAGAAVIVDTTAPKLTITAAPTGSVQATSAQGAAVGFAASATDIVDGAKRVVFTENGRSVASGATFGLGRHTVVATATDAAGNTSQTDIVFSVVGPAAPVAPTALPTVPAPPARFGATADVGLLPVGAPVYAAGMHVLMVGADKQYHTIAGAVAASRDGDVVLVDAGTYTNDFVVVNAKITMLAVGGRVDMVATVPPPNWKGLLTVETDLTVKGFTFEGVHIPDAYGHNGAGIRLDNGSLVLVNDEFRNNQDGLLVNAGAAMTVSIDHCVFNDNGGADGNGAGNIHNVYIGDVKSVTVTNSVFENAQVGHEFKSRAMANTLTNNVFISGVGIGTGSYDIDLPNGGQDTLTNNTIIKGANAENANMVHFGGEGIPYAGSSLFLQGNLFQNLNSNGFGVLNQTATTTTVTGNEFAGLTTNRLVQGPAKLSGNVEGTGKVIADATLVGVVPGSTIFETDGLDHTLTLKAGTSALQGGAGHLTINLETAHVVVIGGSGGMDLTENASTGGNQYETAAGSTNFLRLLGVGMNTIDSEGNDTIVAGNGNQSAIINGSATVSGGTGASQWSVNGTARIDTGSGSASMTVGAAAHLAITGTNSFYKLDSNGGTAAWDTTNAGVRVAGSVQGLGMSMQVYSSTIHLTTAGGSGGVLRLDRGDATIRSYGPEAVYAGSGNITVIASGGAAVYAGTGQLSVFGRGGGGGTQVYGAAGDTVIDGDGGGITYHGSTVANTVEAHLANITILGGIGRMTVYGGARSTIVGGRGGMDLHGFLGGANEVSTVAGSSNVLEVTNSNVHSFGSDAVVHKTGNVSMDVHGKSTVTLQDGGVWLDLYGDDVVTTVKGYHHLTVHAGSTVTVTTFNLDVLHEDAATIAVSFADPLAAGSLSTVTAVGGTVDITSTPGSGLGVLSSGTSAADISASGPVSIDSRNADRIHLGTGPATVNLYGSGAEVWAGSGALSLQDWNWGGGTFTLYGSSGAIALDQGPSTMTFIGGSGDATLHGGQMNLVGGVGKLTVAGAHIRSFVGGTGVADLSLDANGSNIVFGGGTTAVHEWAWGAANVFSFLAGQSGTERIEGFKVGVDRAILGTGVAISSQDVTGGSAHFLLSNGANVTFANVASTKGVFG